MELGKFKNPIESLSPDTHTHTRFKKSTKSEKKFNIVYLIFRSRKLSTQSTKLPDYLQPIAGHTRHIDMSLNWAHSLFWKNLVIPSPDFYFYAHLPYFHSLSEITTQRRYEIKPNCAQYDSDHHISFFFHIFPLVSPCTLDKWFVYVSLRSGRLFGTISRKEPCVISVCWFCAQNPEEFRPLRCRDRRRRTAAK